ncbi:cupin domain-containing protein [Flavicella sediminum]|uniref:cupin domain-containing protein n=1 Tax=Flavicella sediminum TaxID=2585141 RepID=UPI001121DB65|nr:cupin domain-containing protein [Flavicella sediminum]
MEKAELLIKHLDLLPHPEGGYYKETYRSTEMIPNENLSNNYVGDRNVCTAIYFLLKSEKFSAFHKINQDEIWHFHEGSSLKIHQISPEGNYSFICLGNDLLKGQTYQHIVLAGYWFAATVNDKNSYSLVGCTVAPGFDFKDFVLPKRKDLLVLFPQHKEIITSLTHS